MSDVPDQVARLGGFFGEPWPSGVCDTGHQVPVPAGEPCVLCTELIGAGDQGSFMFTPEGVLGPVHRECSLRSVLGGWGHHADHALWCLERHDPDGGLTYRKSALAVWAHRTRCDEAAP